jgi:hypothetical protein
MRRPGWLAGSVWFCLLIQLYAVKRNYYANYFWEGSGCCGVGYGIFWVRRGLTRDFTEVFGERKF